VIQFRASSSRCSIPAPRVRAVGKFSISAEREMSRLKRELTDSHLPNPDAPIQQALVHMTSDDRAETIALARPHRRPAREWDWRQRHLTRALCGTAARRLRAFDLRRHHRDHEGDHRPQPRPVA
jgi:hypothetical protein